MKVKQLEATNTTSAHVTSNLDEVHQVQFNFTYTATNHNNGRLKALYIIN